MNGPILGTMVLVLGILLGVGLAGSILVGLVAFEVLHEKRERDRLGPGHKPGGEKDQCFK